MIKGLPSQSFHHHSTPPIPPKHPIPSTATLAEGGWAGLLHWMEQTDVLLYATAALGILSPALIYCFYQKLHTIYERKKMKRLEAKRRDEAERAEIAIFFTSSRDQGGGAKTTATKLAEVLAKRLQETPPPILDVDGLNVRQFAKFKGVGLFVVESSGERGGEAAKSAEPFLDWLEELAARRSKHSNIRVIRFAIFAICNTSKGDADDGTFGKAAKTFSRRLRAAGAKQLAILGCTDSSLPEQEQDRRLASWAETVALKLEREAMAPASDESGLSMGEEEDDDNEDDDDDDDDMGDGSSSGDGHVSSDESIRGERAANSQSPGSFLASFLPGGLRQRRH